MVTDGEHKIIVQQLNSGEHRDVNAAATEIRNRARGMVSAIVSIGGGTDDDIAFVLNDTVVEIIAILRDGKYRPELSELTTLTYTIAKHKWLDELKLRDRKNAFERRFPSEIYPSGRKAHNSIEYSVFTREEIERTAWAIEQLRPDDRELITKKYLDGLSLKVIAENLGISEEAARKRHERCKKKLKEILGRDPRMD